MDATASATASANLSPTRPPLLTEIGIGFRRNLVPGLILQTLALAVALAYFYWPTGRDICDHLAHLRDQGGYAAGAVIAAVCGGLIPWIVTRWRGEGPATVHPLADCAFMMAYWAWAGFEVDVFYRYQAEWWGAGKAVTTVMIKVACDQFAFTPFLALPQMRLSYRWRESGYRADAWKGLTIPAFLREILVLAASAWVVWIPGCSIIYSMPSGLQFLLFALVLVFWSLVSQMAGRSKQPLRA